MPGSLSMFNAYGNRQFDANRAAEKPTGGYAPEIQGASPVQSLVEALRRYKKSPVELKPIKGGMAVSVKGTF